MGFQSVSRLYSVEILDTDAASEQDAHACLRDLRRINALLGGRRVLRKLIAGQLRRTGLRHFTMLDVGTGSGDQPEYIASRFDCRITGLDRQLRHLRAGLSPLWTAVCGDVRNLPFAPKSFDFVTASLMLHHFQDEEAVELLARFAEIARHAVLVNDLERHAMAWHFIRRVPMVHEISRKDGAASVQQAFTAPELESLARKAGLSRINVRRHIPFRLSLAAELS